MTERQTISWSISLGDAVAYESVSFAFALVAYSGVWLFFANTINALVKNAPAGWGALLLILGMVLGMIVQAIVVAGYIGEGVSWQDSRGRTHKQSRVRFAIAAASISYFVNIMAWLVIGGVVVWFVWRVPEFQGDLNLFVILEYFAARQFGTATPFWIASMALYSFISIIVLKIVAHGKEKAPKTKKPRGARRFG